MRQWELHYSNAHRETYRMDLAGTCRALRAYKCGTPAPDGRTLDGFAKDVLARIRSSQVFLDAGMENN